MEILVTGGTGLLGGNLVHRLCEQGLVPRVLVRPHADLRGLEGLPCTRYVGDLFDAQSLARAMAGVDGVFHCAGLVRFDRASVPQLRRVNVKGTFAMFAAAHAAGVRRVVHVSSVSAVGHGPLDAPATEDSARAIDEGEPYPRSKIEAESFALAAVRDGVEVVIANPTVVIGPFDLKPTSGELLLAVARGLTRFYPSGGTNFVNAQDVAEGLVRLMHHGRSGERYVLGGENLTYREFLSQCADEIGATPPSWPLPEAALAGAARLGDALASLAPSRFAWFNSPLVRAMTLPAYASSAKAERELGYRPRPIRLGIRSAYAWFQQRGYLRADRPLTPRVRVGP
jgi:dihydroflavonol-4-reductase